jgi:sigma-B regulation protein RsbU (phosphoserine phosphatase)
VAEVTGTYLREQLLTRRQKLESALSVSKGSTSLLGLLKEVDAALERMEAGTYGICESCREPVEKERLIADPLVRYCLDHLSADEQRALERDLELAAKIQRELLPQRDLHFGGWETSYHYQPLGLVSGDYCDLIIHEDSSRVLYFALGDASGKGVAASMLMAHLHAIFRTLIASGLPLQELMERGGRVFCESMTSGLFATLVCGRASTTGEVELCNAGHCPALVVREEAVIRLEATGVPLGMFRKGEYATHQVRLAPNETLFLYSDGVSEARSLAGEEYGEARLLNLLASRRGLPPAALIRACIEDLSVFRAGATLSDDLTLMAIRRAA